MTYKIAPFFDKEYPITQKYGENPQTYTMFAVPGHEGIDYGTPNGTPVKAPFDGVILRDTFGDKDYGNFTVVWDKTQNCALWFCHLQDVTTKIGDTVTAGQIIGHTNNTGNSTGPHCHVNFVETDSQGNRLNRDNGKQGFLDLLAYIATEPMATITQKELDSVIRARDDNYNEGVELKKALLTLNQKVEQLSNTISQDARDDHDLVIKNMSLETRINAFVQSTGLPVGTSDELVLEKIKGLLAPHTEVVKNVQPVMDELANQAFMKRAPKKGKNIFTRLIDAIKNLPI